MKVKRTLSTTFVLWLTVLVLSQCRSEPPIQQIDQLIAQGQWAQARQLVTQALQKEWGDTLQSKRLRYRLIKIQKAEMFQPIDQLLPSVPNQALELLAHVEDTLKHFDSKQARFFYFDLYYRKAQGYRLLNQDSLWFKAIQHALNHFTDQHELKRQLYEQAAFYLAERGKHDAGLKMLDRSFSSIKIQALSPNLKEAYFAYLNGNFTKALKVLTTIPVSQKDEHWRHLQEYLEKYGNYLSLEERFKLW